MSRKVSILVILSALTSLGLVIGLTVGFLQPAGKPPIKVVEVRSLMILSDKEKISFFIDEMMDKKQATCLKSILQKESNMRPQAANKQSSAKGVGQLLDSTYKNLGLKHSADPVAQVVATIAYVSRHYGGTNAFCKAWAFHQKHNYY